MSERAREPWDFGRFFQTLTYFEALPIINWFQKMLPVFTPLTPPPLQAGLIFNFQQSPGDLGQTWGALDDVVMGGVSSSSFQLRDKAALFSGKVSTANSGGFTSVRTRNFQPPMNLADYTGLELRVQGDGQRYKFFIRDSDAWDSIGYAYAFDTIPNQWITVRVPFAEMTPVFRAKTVLNAASLKTDRIYSFQLMLSKFEYDGALNPHFTPGEFRLWVQSIGTYE